MAAATINGQKLTYADSGGDGPAIVLGHGYFLDHTIFSAQAAALSPRYRVIAWDARGHGGTPDTDDDSTYSYWDQADDVLGLLDYLNIRQAIVGGVSQGGFIALRAALLAPERVGALILWDTEATPCDPADKVAYRGMFDALTAHGQASDIVEPLSTQLLGVSALRKEWLARWQHRTMPLGSAAECLLNRDDVSSRLNEIKCRALLMWGEFDKSIPKDRMDLLHERLPGATEVHVIAGSAHTPPLTHPAQVNSLILEFLSQ